jgi:glycosyltransferase involved in cell wall biosynthesis
MDDPESSHAGRTNLALVLPSLAGGGAERVGIELANHWARQGRRVTLITIDGATESAAPVDRRIGIVGLGLKRVSRSFVAALWNNSLRVRRLRRAIANASAPCIVSFTDITNVTSLLACRDSDAKVVVCERTEPRRHEIGRVWSRLRKRTYQRASAIVVQTDAVRTWAESQGWRVPVYTIPNPAPALAPAAVAGAAGAWPRPAIVALGRLSHEKGMDLLVEAFARIAPEHPDWSLRIFGEGPERSTLESLAETLGVGGRTCLAGWTPDPIAALRDADVFVLPSRYEGFPNALLEAMAVGLPCISFDCDSGPREIITSAVDGLLVPAGDTAALARALEQVLVDTALRGRLGSAAREVTVRFSRASFFQRWDDVLATVAVG